jgi:hypothetical protein
MSLRRFCVFSIHLLLNSNLVLPRSPNILSLQTYIKGGRKRNERVCVYSASMVACLVIGQLPWQCSTPDYQQDRQKRIHAAPITAEGSLKFAHIICIFRWKACRAHHGNPKGNYSFAGLLKTFYHQGPIGNDNECVLNVHLGKQSPRTGKKN